MKFDVGPTLLLILTEMCEMYLHSFSLHENNLFEKMKQFQLSSPENINNNNNSIAQYNSIDESIKSLLGGAYHVLIDCRFALTGVVLERHGQTMIERGFINNISHLLKLLLLKLLKYLSLFKSINHNNNNNNNNNSSEDRETLIQSQINTIKLLKDYYAKLFKITEWKYNRIINKNISNLDSENSQEVCYLYDILESLHSCEWLKNNL